MLENRENRQLSRREKILSTIIHSFILGWINTWKIGDLKMWINKGLYPNMKRLYIVFQKLPGFTKIQSGIRNYYFQNKEKVLNLFSYEELLWQVHEHRADLKEVVSTYSGKKWFENLINIIRDLFLKDIAGIEWWK